LTVTDVIWIPDWLISGCLHAMRDLPPVLAIVQPNCELGIGDRDQHWQCDGFGPLGFIQDAASSASSGAPLVSAMAQNASVFGGGAFGLKWDRSNAAR
jgi:hypothetical protein